MFNKINYIITILLVTSCSYKPLIELDFNNDTLNLYERQLVSHKRIELDKKNGVNNSPAIKVYYEGYEMGSKTVMRLIKIPIELEEATLNYSVKFSDSFNFVLGGKLHGFVPQNKIVGGLLILSGILLSTVKKANN